MKRIAFVLIAGAALSGLVASMAGGIAHASQEAAPVFVKEIPPGYRDWKVESVAHEAGELNDIRAVLGNDIAIKAYREGTLPFPEGAIVRGRLTHRCLPSIHGQGLKEVRGHGGLGVLVIW